MYQVNTLNLHINDLLLFSFLTLVSIIGHITKLSVSSTWLIDYTSKHVNNTAQIILLIIFFILPGLFFVCLPGLDVFS